MLVYLWLINSIQYQISEINTNKHFFKENIHMSNKYREKCLFFMIPLHANISQNGGMLYTQ